MSKLNRSASINLEPLRVLLRPTASVVKGYIDTSIHTTDTIRISFILFSASQIVTRTVHKTTVTQHNIDNLTLTGEAAA